MRIIAIPCLYYVRVPDDAAEAQVEAELIRTALDSDAPFPDVGSIRPDMAADITTVVDYDIPDNAPTYSVTLTATRREDADMLYDEERGALQGQATAGPHMHLVAARNRYEAELLAVREFFTLYADVQERLNVAVTSIRMT